MGRVNKHRKKGRRSKQNRKYDLGANRIGLNAEVRLEHFNNNTRVVTAKGVETIHHTKGMNSNRRKEYAAEDCSVRKEYKIVNSKAQSKFTKNVALGYNSLVAKDFENEESTEDIKIFVEERSGYTYCYTILYGTEWTIEIEKEEIIEIAKGVGIDLQDCLEKIEEVRKFL